MRINKIRASAALDAAIEKLASDDGRGAAVSSEWYSQIVDFSLACSGGSKTHVAFLGTAILAKATTPDVDVFSVKVKKGTPGAYSARGLCHSVLVGYSKQHGFDLGATGREPLNNQPYFQIDRVDLKDLLARVKPSSESTVRKLYDLLCRLDRTHSRAEIELALMAFIHNRRDHVLEYPNAPPGTAAVGLQELTANIEQFLHQDAEGGRRAQACAAGILDANFSPARVVTEKINDPDRNMPGDIGIRSNDLDRAITLAIEVRDKAVETSDLFVFVEKCARFPIPRAALLAVHNRQAVLDTAGVLEFARSVGVEFHLFLSWHSLLKSFVPWGDQGETSMVAMAILRIRERLIDMAASRVAVESWDRLNK